MNNTDAAAPAADEIASQISKSRHPSETAQGHADSADALKAALAEAGAGPAVDSIEEEAIAETPATEAVKSIVPETVQTSEKVKADESWVEPNEVEKARFSKMMGGAKLRKDL